MRTTSHSRVARVVCALPAALLLVCSSAMADALYLAGAEAARDANYVYAGRIASIEHEQLQNGWAWRLWLDRASYRYDASDVRYRGRAVTAEAGVGYLFGQDPFTGSVFVSALARDTHISPNDPGNRSSGFHTSAKLGMDLNYRVSPRFSTNLGANYTPLNHAYWTRLRLLVAAGESSRWGVEQAWHGDDSYRARQTGLVWLQAPMGGASWGVKLGVRQQRGVGSVPYLGIEWGKSF